MPSQRSAGTARSILFLNTILLLTALALPAMAQIEEVVVTAQKKIEDVQSVPIAVTAFTGADLKSQQIDQSKDLQFHAPNVSYTAGNFNSVDFQIRGIGITAIGYDDESGVAVNFDEVFLADPQLTESAFYDLSGLEILAGPQSTLYGRGATGGAVNINIIKPDLEQMSEELQATYGNYNTAKVEGDVNLPIIPDHLALRVAGEWDRRDGFVTNVYNGSNVDGLDQYSVRGTVRWQPTEKTTVDITGQFSREDDDHMEADKQLCTTDPTGVLGCLPSSAGKQPLNPYATLDTLASSQQGITNFLVASFVPVGAISPAQAQALGSELGLFNLSAPYTTLLPPGYVYPTGDRQVSTNFTPVWRSNDNFMSLKWHQDITPWLDSTFIAGYDHSADFSQESYNNVAALPFPANNNYTLVAPGLTANCLAAIFGSPNLNCAQLALPATIQTFATLAGELGGLSPAQAAAFGANYASKYAPYLGHPGQLPVSGVGSLGDIGGNYSLSPTDTATQQSDHDYSQYSLEERFATSFSGPLNGMLGLYYLHTAGSGDYYVNVPTLDYPGLVVGSLAGVTNPACAASGCILGPSYYHNIGTLQTLTSKAIFGEVYYDVLPDTVKITGGIRFTQDDKFSTGRIMLYSGLAPIGTNSESYYPTTPGGAGNPCASASDPLGCPDIPVKQQFDAWTGRVVVDWTPKLDFTDQTLVYASYSSGYKAGGANPGIEPGLPVPQDYSPENIDAYELGTKNQILNNTLQANGDVYYYDYVGLQVAAIEDNTSVNQNIDAHVWGAEGSLLWQATDRLQLGVNVAHEESNIQHTMLVDPANPTGGNQQSLLVKDDSISATTGENCVLYYNGAFPGLPAGFTAPAGGVHALASQGIPNVAFGSCNPAILAGIPGYSVVGPNGATYQGQPVSMNGHELQNTPNLSVSVNAQYTQPLPGDYALVGRIDLHVQSHFWGDIFEDGATRVGTEEVTDASLQLNSPNDFWYAQVFIKNIFDATNVTGQYTAGQTSGLYTNVFYGDPRTYGVTLGVKFD